MSTTIAAARPRSGLRPTSENESPRGESRPASDEEGPRVYTGRSVDELIPRIERELGRDAIVTRQRSGLNGGVAGFFQHPYVEIEARPGHPRIDLYDEPRAHSSRPAYADRRDDTALPAYAEIGTHTKRPAHAELRDPDAPPAAPARVLDRFAAALADAETAAVADAQAAEEPAFDPPPRSSPRSSRQSAATIAPQAPLAPEPSEPAARTPEVAEAHRRLLERGIEPELADELVAIASAHALALSPADASFCAALAAVLRRRIPAPSAWPASGTSVALVGPGGSGKTSFCAALAAAYRERSTARVACASVLADGEAGHSLLLSPHLLAPTPVGDEQVSLALSHARREGLLLLDTPALPAADAEAVGDHVRLLERLAPDRVLVALPATYGARAATQLLQALAPLKPGAIAITHARETDQLGAAVQAACSTGLPPAFLLDQRRGGEGLLQTDPADLAARLLA